MSGTHARLIVALSDLSPDSDSAVVCAARIAEYTDARLRVVHPLGVIGESLRKALFGAPPLQQRVESAAKRLSKQMESALDGSGVPREVVLDHHRAETVIVTQASGGVADMVIVPANETTAMLPIASLAGVRSPLLFVPRFARAGTPCIVQALAQDVTPDAFLRAQRWMRILQPVLNGMPIAGTDPGELDILLCPDIDADASDAIERSLSGLRRTLTERDPALAVALLPAGDGARSHAFAEAMLRTLVTEARCPVLAVPTLPAMRAVWTPPPFVLST